MASKLDPIRLPPNETNLGLFKISLSTFWLGEPKCTETDLKQSQICPIWRQSDPILLPNLRSLLQSLDKALMKYTTQPGLDLISP